MKYVTNLNNIYFQNDAWSYSTNRTPVLFIRSAWFFLPHICGTYFKSSSFLPSRSLYKLLNIKQEQRYLIWNSQMQYRRLHRTVITILISPHISSTLRLIENPKAELDYKGTIPSNPQTNITF